jgi:hypothetical protein
MLQLKGSQKFMAKMRCLSARKLIPGFSGDRGNAVGNHSDRIRWKGHDFWGPELT